MVLGEDEWCCASALIRTGQQHINDVPKQAALHNIEALKARGAKRVIFACAGCFRASKIDWPRAYGKTLPFEAIHMSQFLAEQLDAGKIKWEKSFDKNRHLSRPMPPGKTRWRVRGAKKGLNEHAWPQACRNGTESK